MIPYASRWECAGLALAVIGLVVGISALTAICVLEYAPALSACR